MTSPDQTLAASLAQWDRLLYRLANRYARVLGADPEDVRGDILLAVVSQYPNYDPERSAFSTWLGVVARTVFGRAMDRQARAVRFVRGAPIGYPDRGEEDDAPLVAVLADPKATDPAEGAGRSELVERLTARLADLPPAQREAVTARYWQGVGTLGPDRREHLDRALAALRQQLVPQPVGGDGF